MSDKDIMKMLGLYDRSITLTLEDDILKEMNKPLEHEEKKKEFLSMFKECYNDIIKIIEKDGRIAVNCFTCFKGMDLSKKYGKPKSK